MGNNTVLEEINACPECHSVHLIRDYGRGELVCEACGLVIDDTYIDQGPEWRAFDSEQRNARTRTGAPADYTAPDKGLSTIIGWENKDSYGRSIPTKNRAQLQRLRKWQYRMRRGRSVEKRIASALPTLNRIASGMRLPRNVREAAVIIYRKAIEKDLLKGRSIELMAVASLYAASRQCGVMRTLDEFSEVSRMERREVGRTYRFLARELKLELMPASPQDYVERFCNKLGLGEHVRAYAMDILRRAEEEELISGRGPTGVAAAAIYIASIRCREHRIQRQVADTANVTEVTIRNRYKELVDKLHIKIET